MPVLGLSTYGWGGEQIAVDRFNVPSHLRNVGFIIEAGSNGRYTLIDRKGVAVPGRVGEALFAGDIELFISELVAREGAH